MLKKWGVLWHNFIHVFPSCHIEKFFFHLNPLFSPELPVTLITKPELGCCTYFNCPVAIFLTGASLMAQMEESACDAGDVGPIPGLGRPPGEGNGNPLLPGEFHVQRNLVGHSPWGCKELDTTKRLTHTHTFSPLGGELLEGRNCIISCA